MATIAHRLKFLAIDCNGQAFKLGASVGPGSPGDTVTLTFADKLTTSGVDVPTITSSYYLPITIDADHPGSVEVFWITAYTTGATTATAVRGQEGSQAVAHSSGATCSNGPTTYDIKANFDAPWGGDNLSGGPYDYEFLGNGLTSLPSGWSWHNQGSATYLEHNGVGTVQSDLAEAWQLRGIERLLPTASSFIVYAKIQLSATHAQTTSPPGWVQPAEIFTDGVTNNDNTYQSATAGFDPADVNHMLLSPSVPMGTFITSVVDSSHITLSQPTTTTLTGETFQIVGRSWAVFGLGGNLVHSGLYLRQAGGGGNDARLSFGIHWGNDGSGGFPVILFNQAEIVLWDTDTNPLATANHVGLSSLHDALYVALRKNSPTSWDFFCGPSGNDTFLVGNVDPTAYGTAVGFPSLDFTPDTVGLMIANNTGNVAGIDVGFFRIR